MSTSSGVSWGPEELGVLDYPTRKIVMQATNQIEATYRLHACQKEPWTKDFIDAIPDGGIFYDVGACDGSYSLIAATRGLTTVAIEPSAPNYAALVRNAMLNPPALETMLILPVALAAGHGLAWLDYQDVRAGAASHVVGSDEKLWMHRQRVCIFTLDELISIFKLPIPTHMKLDTDGGELSVLAGMDQVLRHEQLVGLMVEMPRDAEAQITAYLAERGWQVGERFAEREGRPIEGVVYARFDRIPVAAEPEPKRGRRKVAVAA